MNRAKLAELNARAAKEKAVKLPHPVTEAAANLAKAMNEYVPPKKKPTGPRFQELFRLPDGAQFQATYQAEQQQWGVSLTIGSDTRAAYGSSLHKTIMTLGQAWHREQGGK